MADLEAAAPAENLGRVPAIAQWIVLFTLSALIGAALEAIGIPAALLLGPMIAAVIASVAGMSIAVPRPAYYGSQALVGCLIASTFNPSTIATIGQNWVIFVSVVTATYLSSLALGYGMSRLQILPGSTAVWGSAPGAASAMMLMAEAFGADPRLVAFMQYLRVVFVALAASFVARFWAAPGGSHGFDFHALVPAIQPLAFAETLAIAGFGAVVGRLLRIPAGPLLIPLVVGGVLRATGIVTFDLPPWLLAAKLRLRRLEDRARFYPRRPSPARPARCCRLSPTW